MFPDDVPEHVVRYWEAKERWYASGTHKEPTREEFVKKFVPPISTRTLDRIRHAYRTLVGRWPPRRSDRPPWQPPEPDGQELNVVPGEIHRLRGVRVAGFDDDGRPVIVMQLYDTLTGAMVQSYVDEPREPPGSAPHRIALFAATMFGLGLLDAIDADGQLDGVIRMVHFVGCHLWFG
jgi:hypothetical protein